jgi:nucleolar protein 56
VSLDINRQDKHIIQSIAILDQLDKNLNTFSMRIKEWFSWHFPELAKIVTDNYTYVRIVNLIGVIFIL